LLLLKANEEVINYDIHYEERLDYFLGNHNLGNHGYTINTHGEDTVFTFTFFNDYCFCIVVNENSEILSDTLIIDKEKEIVISQYYGEVFIDVKKVLLYFQERIKKYKKRKGEQIDLKKIKNLMKSLKHFGLGIDFIEVKLQIADLEVVTDKEEIQRKTQEYEEKLKRRIFSPDWQEIPEQFNIDFQFDLPIYGWQNFIYIFYNITKIELTEDEITFLIPTSKGDFSSFKSITYISTVKEPIKRTYSQGDNLVFQSIISKELIDYRKGNIETGNEIIVLADDAEKKRLTVATLRSKWLKKFGIGEELSYGYNDETDTYFIRIDNKALPEYGLGFGLIIHILMSLSNEFNLYKFRKSKKRINFPSTFIIEEPETGLHPAFQSKIAEMIVDIQKTLKVNIIVETHSEYFIRKLQYLTATNEIDPGDAVIYYFNNPNKIPKGEEQIKKITIENDGSLTDNFGPGFIDEGTNLRFDLIRLNKNRQN
jgi:hypothetical protein